MGFISDGLNWEPPCMPLYAERYFKGVTLRQLGCINMHVCIHTITQGLRHLHGPYIHGANDDGVNDDELKIMMTTASGQVLVGYGT